MPIRRKIPGKRKKIPGYAPVGGEVGARRRYEKGREAASGSNRRSWRGVTRRGAGPNLGSDERGQGR
jgi:hypothetical protein